MLWLVHLLASYIFGTGDSGLRARVGREQRRPAYQKLAGRIGRACVHEAQVAEIEGIADEVIPHEQERHVAEHPRHLRSKTDRHRVIRDAIPECAVGPNVYEAFLAAVQRRFLKYVGRAHAFNLTPGERGS